MAKNTFVAEATFNYHEENLRVGRQQTIFTWIKILDTNMP